MNEVLEFKENEKLKNLIYETRGVKVILDSDLAKLFDVETKRINEAVRRNKEKFPEQYSFKLTEDESKSFLVANCDQKKETRGGRYKNPRVFTEHGVVMIATILKSKKAIEESVKIVNAFVDMKNYLVNIKPKMIESYNLLLDYNSRFERMENKLDKHENQIKEILSNFNEENNHIYFSGEFYDAHSFMMDIFNKSKKEIIIIDNYLDKNLLDILKSTNKNIIIVTNKYNSADYNKYKSQYGNIKIKIINNIHDRFIIIDKKVLYHCGASFKDLAKKMLCYQQNRKY